MMRTSDRFPLPRLRAAARSAFLAASLIVASAAQAELQIDITKGVTDPIPVAVVPFARSVPADAGIDVAAIVQRATITSSWAAWWRRRRRRSRSSSSC